MDNFKKFFYIIFFIFFNIKFSYSHEVFFIDIDLLLSESKQGKIIILKLNEINNQNKNQLKLKENELINLKNEIEIKKNILKKEELDKTVSKYNLILKNFNDLKISLSTKYEEEKKNQLQIFFNKLTPLLEKYMSDKSIDIIIDKKNILLANNKYDATSDIIKLINNNS